MTAARKTETNDSSLASARTAGALTAEKAAHVDIVFDGPPGPESGRFVEVEDASGKSINFGQWVKREDGYWVLRIAAPADARALFLNRLRSLFNIDGFLLPELNKYDWTAFRADPPKFFMRCESDKADAIWREVDKRQTPKTGG